MNLYTEILKSTDGLDGWAEPGKRVTLANLVFALRPLTIIEIGVWGGQSLIPMAMAARSISNPSYHPEIIAIDPWEASESVKGQDAKDAEWWGKQIGQQHHEMVYQKFIAKLQELGLRELVTVVRMPSRGYLPKHQIELLHLDGNHGPAAYEDIKQYGPFIRQGGVCVLDDLNWTGGAVGKAAEWLKQNGFIELHPLGTGAVYQKL